jgi:hypothetical protein
LYALTGIETFRIDIHRGYIAAEKHAQKFRASITGFLPPNLRRRAAVKFILAAAG